MASPQPELARARRARPIARRRVESGLVACALAPLDPDRVAAALPALPQLPAPAKLLLAPGGALELRAEIPLAAERSRCELLARQALDGAWAWLEGEPTPPAGAAAAETERAERTEQALAALGWPWERSGDCAWRVAAADGPTGPRIRVELLPDGALRAVASTAVPSASPGVPEALAHFALESNHRLRFARASVAPRAGRVAQVVWDAVVPAGLPSAAALPEIVRAVAFAHREMARAFRALAHARVAEIYLRLRSAAPTPTVPPSPDGWVREEEDETWSGS